MRGCLLALVFSIGGCGLFGGDGGNGTCDYRKKTGENAGCEEVMNASGTDLTLFKTACQGGLGDYSSGNTCERTGIIAGCRKTKGDASSIKWFYMTSAIKDLEDAAGRCRADDGVLTDAEGVVIDMSDMSMSNTVDMAEALPPWRALDVRSVTNHQLFAVWGSAAKGLWAVGAVGAVVRSNDKGATFSSVNLGTSTAQYAVTGVGDRVVIAGQSDAVRHSTDGSNWSTSNLGFAQAGEVRGLVAAGTTLFAWATTVANQTEYTGRVYRNPSSGDAGQWTELTLPTTFKAIAGVWPSSASDFYVVAYDMANTTTHIMHSTDSGANFTTTMRSAEQHKTIWGLSAADVVVAGSTIVRSTDGTTWSAGTGGSLAADALWGETTLGWFAPVHASAPTIWRATAGTNTWTQESFAAPDDIKSIWGVYGFDGDVFVVGNDQAERGIILKR